MSTVNNTPAVKKQTFLVNMVTLISLTLATLTQNEWFMETFTQTGIYAGMLLTAVTLLLGFLNPIGHQERLDKLEPGEGLEDEV